MIKAISTAIGLLILLSCARENEVPRQNEGDKKRLVRIEFPDDSTASMHLFYNSNGDIERMFNGTDTAEYRYEGDSIVMDWVDGYGNMVAAQHFKLDGQGRVISIRILDPSGTLFAVSTYEYSPEGKLLKHVRHNMRTNDVFTMDYQYAGDDIAHVLISQNGQQYDRFSYEYDTTKRNMFEFDMDVLPNDYMTKGRFGSVNKHLVQKAYRIDLKGDTTSLRYFTYELDPDGYVLKKTDRDGQYDYSTTRIFIYQ